MGVTPVAETDPLDTIIKRQTRINIMLKIFSHDLPPGISFPQMLYIYNILYKYIKYNYLHIFSTLI